MTGCFEHRNKLRIFIKYGEISLLAAESLAFKEQLCSIELVIWSVHPRPHRPHTNMQILRIIRRLMDSHSDSNRTLVWGSDHGKVTAHCCMGIMVRSLLTPDTSQYGKNTVLANAPLIWRRLKQRGTRRHTSCTMVQVYVNSVSRLFDVERNSSDTAAAAIELLKYGVQ